MALLPTADAVVANNDLPRLEEAVKQGFHFCGKTLNVISFGITVTSLTFDGEEPCTERAFDVQDKRSAQVLVTVSLLGLSIVRP